VTVTPELRAFAEAPDRYTWLSGDVERDADDRRCIIQGSVWAGVASVQVDADDVEPLVQEVRRLVPSAKSLTWWIGPSARPHDLADRLLALGLRTPDTGATLHALALTTAPPAGPPGIEVTKVESYDDQLEAVEVMWDAFATPPERREQQRPHLRAEFEAAQSAGVPATFLARVDGRAAGLGRSVYSDHGVFLIAGAVAEWARGRGVYRSLVRARWDDAVDRGTPGLVTEAMPDTSYPILKRLGFEDVCTITRLEDPR
jgi:hypothetical protein